MYACFGSIHLPHTESTQSETPHQLSPCGVRLHVNWVIAEWDSTSTESTQKAPTYMKISSFRVDSVDVEPHLALTQLTGTETLCQLSHCQTIKNLNKLANLRTKLKTLKNLTIWPKYVWSMQKTRTKISCKCTLKIAYIFYFFNQPLRDNCVPKFEW